MTRAVSGVATPADAAMVSGGKARSSPTAVRRFRVRLCPGSQGGRGSCRVPTDSEFPSLERRYRAPDLFPTFRNRVINTSRSDRQVYLSHLGLDAVTCDELAELSVSGGRSHSDSYEIFPAIEPDLEGSFRMQLMLHGLRHTHQYAIEAIERLESGEELRVAVELNNPVIKRAILVYTKDYHVLGWLPRYIAEGLYRGCDWRLPEVEATVVQVNRNAPLSNRLLLDFSGRLPPGVNPMRDLVQFQPIAGADEDETA